MARKIRPNGIDCQKPDKRGRREFNDHPGLQRIWTGRTLSRR